VNSTSYIEKIIIYNNNNNNNNNINEYKFYTEEKWETKTCKHILL